MSIEFKLPQVAEGVESADVAVVHVSEGDTIEADQIVIEVETEKAVADIPCPHAGKVSKVHVSVGDTIEVGSLLLTIEAESDAGTESKSDDSGPDEKAEQGGEQKEKSEEKPQDTEDSGDKESARKQKQTEQKKPQPSGGSNGRRELVVVGGGPGGYPAAFEAADRGMKVTLVTDEPIPGGVCLHRGCIPSKALLHVAKLLHEAREASHWGLSYNEPEIDLDKLRNFKGRVVNQLTGGVSSLCRSRGVELVVGRGRFVDSNTLEVTPPTGDPQTLEFEHAIIATGSSPAMPGMFAIGDDRVMDSTGALDLPDIPEKLLVIGGGYIGLEMGSVYAALGSKVTVVEMTSGLLPGADRDLVRPLQKRLTNIFEAIHLNTKVAGLTAREDGILTKLEGEGVEPEQLFDRVLVSVGRRPNSSDLGLENTDVVVDDKGFIRVDSKLRTADPAIQAVGDVAGEPMLAHKATREGKVAAEVLAGEPAEFDNIAIPAVVFTDPEIAWCGLTETQAKAENRDVQVMRFPWAASGRAQTLERTEGLTKIIVEPQTERVLGIGIVGAGAGELIGEGVLAVETAAVARDLAETIHAHPTLSETLMESAEGAIGHATHVYRPKKK